VQGGRKKRGGEGRERGRGMISGSRKGVMGDWGEGGGNVAGGGVGGG